MNESKLYIFFSQISKKLGYVYREMRMVENRCSTACSALGNHGLREGPFQTEGGNSAHRSLEPALLWEGKEGWGLFLVSFSIVDPSGSLRNQGSLCEGLKCPEECSKLAEYPGQGNC